MNVLGTFPLANNSLNRFKAWGETWLSGMMLFDVRYGRSSRIVIQLVAWNGQVLAEVAAWRSVRRGGRASATLQCLQRWDRTESGRPGLLPHTLVIAKEECFVFEDRAADGTAKLVLEPARITGSLGHRKRVTRQIGIAFTIVEEQFRGTHWCPIWSGLFVPRRLPCRTPRRNSAWRSWPQTSTRNSD